MVSCVHPQNLREFILAVAHESHKEMGIKYYFRNFESGLQNLPDFEERWKQYRNFKAPDECTEPSASVSPAVLKKCYVALSPDVRTVRAASLVLENFKIRSVELSFEAFKTRSVALCRALNTLQTKIEKKYYEQDISPLKPEMVLAASILPVAVRGNFDLKQFDGYVIASRKFLDQTHW